MNDTTIVFDSPLPPWLVGLAAAIALTVAVLIIRSEGAHIKPRVRRLLVALAAAAAVMLAGLMLGPTLIRTRPDPQKPRCSVLVDASRSMLITDTYTGDQARWLNEHLKAEADKDGPDAPESTRTASRLEIVRMLLSGADNEWLKTLRKDFELSGRRFATEIQGQPLDAAAPPFEVDEEGYSTALGKALQLAGAGPGGLRPRAVILISDGACNTGADPSEVARVLGRLGVPVFAIGVGNPTPPSDAAVLGLDAPENVLLGDEVLLTARVATTGLSARRLPVRLMAEGRVIQEKHAVTLPSGQPVNVSFSFVPRMPGRRQLTVIVPKQDGEDDESNNQATAVVDVVERKINVLLIDEVPRWEFRFIRNVLERDKAVKLTVCVTRPEIGPIKGPGYVEAPPTEKKDLAEYNLVILGDIAPAGLPDGFLKELSEMIRLRAGSLIVVAGRRGHYRELAGTPIEKILPVKLDDVLAGTGRGGLPFRVELTAAGSSHLVTRLLSRPEENELAWSGLPPMRWAADVSGVARGASSLLVHPYRLAGASRLPLVAVHRVGAGKVMFCGVEETWRWRKGVGDKYHYRFWAQTVRWMAKRPPAEGDPRARLLVDRTACYTGETVQIEVYCLGHDGYPLENARVSLKVSDENGRSRHLATEPAPGGWGVYRATFTPDLPGTLTIQPIVSAYGEEPLSSSASFEVARADLEKNFLAQDRNTLQSIAQASGGQYLQFNEVERLAGALTAKVQRQDLIAEYNPCRHWLYYTILTLILGTAWFIRKRNGLA